MKKIILLIIAVCNLENVCSCLSTRMVCDLNYVAEAKKILNEKDRFKLYEKLTVTPDFFKEYCLTGKLMLLFRMMLEANYNNPNEYRMPEDAFMSKLKWCKKTTTSLKKVLEFYEKLLKTGNIEYKHIKDIKFPKKNNIAQEKVIFLSLRNTDEVFDNVAHVLFSESFDKYEYTFEETVRLCAILARSTSKNGVKCCQKYVSIVDSLESDIIAKYKKIQDKLKELRCQTLKEYAHAVSDVSNVPDYIDNNDNKKPSIETLNKRVEYAKNNVMIITDAMFMEMIKK